MQYSANSASKIELTLLYTRAKEQKGKGFLENTACVDLVFFPILVFFLLAQLSPFPSFTEMMTVP